MKFNDKIRDPDEWWEEKYLILEKEIEKGNKIRVFEDTHYDIDTEESFWHGIQIQRISKTRKGKWRYREKINIPYEKFPDFCALLLKVRKERFGIYGKKHFQQINNIRNSQEL
jgi:hypothetical protein